MTEALTLNHVADAMQDIDIAIMSTHSPGDAITSRPMSNNSDVRFDGTSYYFSQEDAQCVKDIARKKQVALGFSSGEGIFSSATYVVVEGEAELIRDKSAFQKHWNPDLDEWFEQGADTPGLVLIKVRARKAKIWERNQEREFVFP